MDIKKIKEISIENKIPFIREKTSLFICEFINKNKINNLLEIGSGLGYSSSFFSLKNPNLMIDSIEKNKDKYLFCSENIINENISFINACAYEFIPNKKYDCIFIDGPKSKQIILFEKYINFLNVEGYIIIDNIFLKDLDPNKKNSNKIIKKNITFQKYLKERVDWKIDIIDIDDGIAICNRKK